MDYSPLRELNHCTCYLRLDAIDVMSTFLKIRGRFLRVDKVLTIEGIFKLAAERGLKPRKWIWKRLQPYNGFNHEQRVRKWQALHLAIQLGLIPPADNFPCENCGTTSRQASISISYHSIDYSSMTDRHPLCKSCHTREHIYSETSAGRGNN